MKLDKLFNSNVCINEMLLNGVKPNDAIELKTGDGSILYNPMARTERCKITSGSSNEDVTELNLKGLNFKYGMSDKYYHFFIVIFHNVVVTPSLVTSNGTNPELNNSWKIGLKSGDEEIFYLHPYYKRTDNRAHIQYKTTDGNFYDAGNWTVYANQRRDISFPFIAGEYTPKLWTDGLANRLLAEDIPNNVDLQGKTLYPFLSVKNIDGVSSITFDGVSIRAYDEYDSNLIYN